MRNSAIMETRMGSQIWNRDDVLRVENAHDL